MKRKEVEVLANSVSLNLTRTEGTKYSITRRGGGVGTELYCGSILQCEAYLRGYLQWHCYIRSSGSSVVMRNVRRTGDVVEVRFADDGVWEMWLNDRLVLRVSDVWLAVTQAYTITHL